MNRLIKFRAWTGSEMMQIHSLKTNYTDEDDMHFDVNGKEYPLMQYTGLQDKNGKDIYEGDIVEEYGVGLWAGSLEKAIKRENTVLKIVPITWSDEELCFMVGDSRIGVFKIWDNLKIVGNIYQNPELMDQKND